MLVRLELSNFKSYRGHQTIGPFKAFSCVIGPNGSGKSNLMDAISFVLGIKTAQLRSRQLKDLVYRGRKLVRGGNETESTTEPSAVDESDDDDGNDGDGTAKTAWVMAVYEDAQRKEWRYQRTVNISGSSEYKINGKIATASAYNQSLEKHNILVKAKNFLVFQGDVEAVARQTPKELCRLIEQISGSLELAAAYDKAKDAQDKATLAASENIQTKKEIAKEYRAYKEHKTEAAKLTKLRQERDDLIVQHVLWRLYHIQEGIDSASADVTQKNAELKGLRMQHDSHEKSVAAARKELASLQAQIVKQENVVKQKERALEQDTPRLVAFDTQIEHSKKKAANSASLAEKVQRDEKRQSDGLEVLRSELERTQKLAEEAEEAQRRAAQQQGKALSDADIAQYRQLKAKANTLLPVERQKLSGLQRRVKTLKGETTGLEEKQEELRRRTERLSTEIFDLEARRSEVEAKSTTLSTRRTQAKQEVESIQAERARINQLETETNEKLQNIYTKLLAAGTEAKQSDKEKRLKETIDTLKNIYPEVHGRVVDLCKPTAARYQTAVSVVLGRNLDAIVIDHEKTAIECINYLRNQRLGQATFIPLDSIQAKPTNDKYRNFHRNAKLAIDAIEYNPQFEAAMYHACGNSLICDTLDVARYVCYDKGQDVKAVTLDGTVIHKSGSITGGQSAGGSGRKWDEKDIQGLHKQREQLMAHLDELLKQKPKSKTVENLLGDIARLDAELVIVKDDLSAIKLRLTGLKSELKLAEKDLKGAQSDHDQNLIALQALEAEIAELARTINEFEDDVFADFCQQIEVDHIREYEEVQLRVAQLQSAARVEHDAQIARLSHAIAFETQQLQQTQQRLRTLQASIESEQTNLADVKAKQAELEEEMQAAQGEIASLRNTLEGTQRKAEEKRSSLEEIKKASVWSTKVLDRAIKEIASWNDTIERLGVERVILYRRCKFEDIDLPLLSGSLDAVPMDAMETAGDAMNVDEDEEATQRPLQARDYGIEVDFSDLSDVERENGAEDFGEELQESIAKLDAEILRMAPNMKAGEKMGGVQAKLSEAERDVDRVRKASMTARETFNAIRKERTDLFNKAYTHIADRINQVYKDLTKGAASPMGGVAYLTLEDSEEPYLAGIKYHAMPPMKRFRDMDQLSGGEQTVAALALLFAIHSYQPAPFFVLDEVDAALDNTNVARVARYLREHSSDEFQFIVISLKDTLYEKSNSLVGVYRDQEVNSSRSLTLDLSQYA